MDFFDLSFWQGFLGNLFATILGVAIGIPVAFWINRKVESDAEQEKKTKILRVLLDELEQIRGFIDRWKTKKNKYRFLTPQAVSMSDETWRAFSDGGELQWIRDPTLLQQLAKTYVQVKHVKFVSESMWISLDRISLVNLFFLPAVINGTGTVLSDLMDDLDRSVVKTIDLIKQNLEQ